MTSILKTLPGLLGLASVISLLVAIAARDELWLAVALAQITTAVPFLLSRRDRAGGATHPGTLVGITLLFGLAGQSVYVAINGPEVNGLLSGLNRYTLIEGCLIMAIGICAMAGGYVVAPQRRRPSPGVLAHPVPSGHRTLIAVFLLLGIALLAFGIYAPEVGIDGPEDILTSQKRFVNVAGGQSVLGYHRALMGLAGTGAIFGTAVLAVRTEQPRRLLLSAVLGSVVITAYFALVTSSRSDLFTVLVAMAVARAVVSHQLLSARFLVATAVVSVLGLTLLGGIRSLSQGNASSAEAAFGPNAVIEQLVASRDWADVAPVSVIVERVPSSVSFKYGTTLAGPLFAPVPRALWPGKPDVRLGPQIGEDVFGFPSTRRTGDPPGLIGELWVNGGLPFLLAGMSLFGVLLRQLAGLVARAEASRSPGLAALCGVLVVGVAFKLMTSDFTGSAIYVILNGLPLLVLGWACADQRSP